ncbi:growth/differentiation factor 7 isoform X2 [Cavia porcellus]
MFKRRRGTSRAAEPPARPRARRRPAEPMDLSAAAALCLWLLSACRPRDGLGAAAVLRAAGAGPARGPGGGGGGRTLAAAAGASPVQAASESGARSARRAPGPGFRNGSVVPHHFMMALYRSLSGRAPAGEASAPGHGRADTITGFADQATQDESAAETGQSFLFDVSSLPDADEVVGAELRVLRREPARPDPGSATASPLLLLSTCPGTARAPRLLHSRVAEALDGARWEVFDVGDAVRSHRREPRAARAFCLLLRAVDGPARSPLAPRLLGFGWPGAGGAAAQERALLVVASRTQRKESLFREIRAQARALGAALAGEPPPDPGPGPGFPRVVLGGRRRRRTALAGTRAAQGGSGGAGRGHGRRGRSRCSRKPLHVDFKELGWDDWIIAPLDYEAYHCEGVCDFPLRSHLEPTNHAIIQTLLNSMAPDAAPASCCVPARLSPISILYIDAANNVVYKQYEDMVVEACGCR